MVAGLWSLATNVFFVDCESGSVASLEAARSNSDVGVGVFPMLACGVFRWFRGARKCVCVCELVHLAVLVF